MKQNLANDEQFNARILQYYQKAVDDINKTIDANAALIVDEHGNQTGYKPVSKEQMEAFQREAKDVVASANEMRANGHNPTYDDFNKEVNRRMRVYNATMRINRLELLKSQIGANLIPATAKTDQALQSKLSDDYIDECKRQAGIMKVTARPSMWTGKKVAKIVMAQTESANFSQRLWANQDALKARLDQVIATGIIQGQNPREMARRLKSQVRDTVTNYRYVTERIARTESARVQFKAQMGSIRGNGFKYVQYYAEIGACHVCSDIANDDPEGLGIGVYKEDDVPQLPIHPNCRCSVGAKWIDGKHNLTDTDVSVGKYYDHKIPFNSKANAVLGRIHNSQPVQYRVFDQGGKPKVDFDLTDHGFPKRHPVVPHAHDWVDGINDRGVKYKRRNRWRKLSKKEIVKVERWRNSYDRR